MDEATTSVAGKVTVKRASRRRGKLDFEKVSEEIKGIISEIVEIPLDKLDCDAHFIDELGIDSLLALEVLSALEKRFGIEVPEEDLMQFTTVNKVIAVAREKLEHPEKAPSDGRPVAS